MNTEAFERTKNEKRVTFFSRSKNRLWTKGEESGNHLEVNSMLLDCDNDTILVKVKPLGPVWHTGSDTCFDEKNGSGDFLMELEQIIAERKMNLVSTSYVSSLFNKGMNKIAQKLGEEAVELFIEAMDDNEELFKNEAADLLFHYLILLSAKGYSINDIIRILRSRNCK